MMWKIAEGVDMFWRHRQQLEAVPPLLVFDNVGKRQRQWKFA